MEQTQQEVKHSPGPWSAEWEGSQWRGWADGRCIANVNSGARYTTKEHWASNRLRAEANARLIADAPRLKAVNEALLEFCRAVRDRYNTDDRMGGLGDWLLQVIALAEAQPGAPRTCAYRS